MTADDPAATDRSATVSRRPVTDDRPIGATTRARAAGMAAVIAVVLGLVAAAPSAGAGPGNSQNAKACQKGGYARLARSTSPGTPFASQGECVSFGAKGGTIVPYAPATNTTVPVTETAVPVTGTVVLGTGTVESGTGTVVVGTGTVVVGTGTVVVGTGTVVVGTGTAEIGTGTVVIQP